MFEFNIKKLFSNSKTEEENIEVLYIENKNEYREDYLKYLNKLINNKKTDDLEIITSIEKRIKVNEDFISSIPEKKQENKKIEIIQSIKEDKEKLYSLYDKIGDYIKSFNVKIDLIKIEDEDFEFMKDFEEDNSKFKKNLFLLKIKLKSNLIKENLEICDFFYDILLNKKEDIYKKELNNLRKYILKHSENNDKKKSIHYEILDDLEKNIENKKVFFQYINKLIELYELEEKKYDNNIFFLKKILDYQEKIISMNKMQIIKKILPILKNIISSTFILEDNRNTDEETIDQNSQKLSSEIISLKEKNEKLIKEIEKLKIESENKNIEIEEDENIQWKSKFKDLEKKYNIEKRQLETNLIEIEDKYEDTIVKEKNLNIALRNIEDEKLRTDSENIKLKEELRELKGELRELKETQKNKIKYQENVEINSNEEEILSELDKDSEIKVEDNQEKVETETKKKIIPESEVQTEYTEEQLAMLKALEEEEIGKESEIIKQTIETEVQSEYTENVDSTLENKENIIQNEEENNQKMEISEDDFDKLLEEEKEEFDKELRKDFDNLFSNEHEKMVEDCMVSEESNNMKTISKEIEEIEKDLTENENENEDIIYNTSEQKNNSEFDFSKYEKKEDNE